MSEQQSHERDRTDRIAAPNAGTLPGAVRLRLPATSANLGPGFDAVGLAMALTLTIEARPLPSPGGAELTLAATGRDAERCGRTRNNMIFETYRTVLMEAGRSVTPLDLRVHNQIPLGMGCGSSAAARLGGVMLANHFGRLGWSLHGCMEEACRREGHPDNVAACALGYMTVSAVGDEPSAVGNKPSVVADEPSTVGDKPSAVGNKPSCRVSAATCGQGLDWKLLLALPAAGLATEKARALLPADYSRADTVANVQRTALLVAAFALGRGELLRVAMQDRMHQPYRMETSPLLPKLLPLAGAPDEPGGPGVPGILGVALSGAGPAVLLVLAPEAATGEIISRVRLAAGNPALEVVETRIGVGASQDLPASAGIRTE